MALVLLPPSHSDAKSPWPVSLPTARQQVAGEVMAVPATGAEQPQHPPAL